METAPELSTTYVARVLSYLFTEKALRLPSLTEAAEIEVLTVLNANKIGPIFLRACKQDPALRRQWEDRVPSSAQALRGNAKIIQILGLANDALVAEGIKCLFYKGPLQQLMLYGGPAEKISSDGDILVGPKDFDRAVLALKRIGFVVTPECQSFWWRHFLGEQHLYRPDIHGLSLDLHMRLQQPLSPQPRLLSAFLDQRTHLGVGARQLPVPSLNHVALVAAMNLTKGIQGRHCALGHALDLLTVLNKLAEPERTDLFGEARRQGLYGTLLIAYKIASEALEVTIGAIPSTSFAIDPLRARTLLIAPDPADALPPRRRALLSALCDNRLVDLPVESARWILSEAARLQSSSR